ncbi:MAG: carboxymuconolactone decarboxylase family protein [Solirubrobacterales bacterium]|nr:carboxymuconolactone decarboxylase family protein [Solirubrobacterales bacterium]
MTRIQDASAGGAGPLTKVLLRLSRRKLRQMTGRAPEGMLGPLEAYARLPRLLVGYGMFEDATARLHGVPERLKALAELKAATLTSCEYCIDIGSQLGRRAGLSDAELLALASYRESELFDDLDMLVLDYAVAMSRTPVEVSDRLFGQLREALDESQLVELTHVIALENMRGRFNLGLGYGAAGFCEGMVCALPEHPTNVEAPAPALDGAGTQVPA